MTVGLVEGIMPGVLDGIRILDFGRYIAGPFCAALLGDLGAEVIRIERLGGGEDRFFIPVGAGEDGGGAMFLAMNRNKRGMTLDPASPKGREVVRNLVATADGVVANLLLIEQSLTGVDRTAIRNRGFNSAPGDIFRTADGWIIATVIGQPMFRRWCRMIGEDHWLADPRFADDQARADHGEIISARMSQWCAAKTCAEALAELEKASIVAGQVYSPQQALDDDHIRAAGLLEERAYPGLDRTVPLAPTPIELSETPGTYRRPAPLLGEHTDEILTGLGYSPAEIAALRKERVI